MSAEILEVINGSPMLEATDRLDAATKAFHGFMSLINDGENLNGAELYCLLAPIEQEFDAALQCLRTARDL